MGLPVLDAEGMVDGYDLGPSPAFSPQVLDGMGGEPEELAQLRRSTQIAVEMDLMGCNAGIVAEARYRKCSAGWAALMGGGSDMEQLRAVLATWFPDAALRKEAAILAERRTAALIRSRSGWAAITALAGALLERGKLSGEEADPLFIAAYGHERPSLRAWRGAWPPSLEMIRAGQMPGLEVT